MFLLVLTLAVVVPAYANRGIDWINNKANLGLPKLPEAGFNLGLDLQGGAHLIYEANTAVIADKDRASAVEGVRDVIERRVRGGLGVAEPLVQTTVVGNDYRIIVELPGVTDVNQAIKMIGETPVLEFKEENNDPPRDLTKDEQKQLDDFNKAADKKAKEVLWKAIAGKDFTALVTEYSEDAASKDKGGNIGYVSAETHPEIYKWAASSAVGAVDKTIIKSFDGLNVVKKLAERDGAKKGEESFKEYEIARIYVKTKTAADIVPPKEQWKFSGLSGKQLKRAEVTDDTQSGQIQVSLKFDDEGTKLFSEITTRNVGKPVAIFLDGSPISIPKVNEPILSGSAVITGGFTLAEAKQLSQRLNSGALPVPVELISQQKVDATLGMDSLRKSFWAGIIGLLAVAVYTILYYRLPGVLAVLALLVYSALSLAIFKLIGVTLTLSGIAGFILSIGMAVDANVLIFERLKEELRLGRTLRSAMEESFIRAWPSIRDSNITTLISCAFMVWMGTGFVQGFAVTLSIGILASMFTAITITRTFMRFVAPFFKEEGNWLFWGYHKKDENIKI